MSLRMYNDVAANEKNIMDATNIILLGPAGLTGAEALFSVTNAGVCS